MAIQSTSNSIGLATYYNARTINNGQKKTFEEISLNALIGRTQQERQANINALKEIPKNGIINNNSYFKDIVDVKFKQSEYVNLLEKDRLDSIRALEQKYGETAWTNGEFVDQVNAINDDSTEQFNKFLQGARAKAYNDKFDYQNNAAQTINDKIAQYQKFETDTSDLNDVFGVFDGKVADAGNKGSSVVVGYEKITAYKSNFKITNADKTITTNDYEFIDAEGVKIGDDKVAEQLKNNFLNKYNNISQSQAFDVEKDGFAQRNVIGIAGVTEIKEQTNNQNDARRLLVEKIKDNINARKGEINYDEINGIISEFFANANELKLTSLSNLTLESRAKSYDGNKVLDEQALHFTFQDDYGRTIDFTAAQDVRNNVLETTVQDDKTNYDQAFFNQHYEGWAEAAQLQGGDEGEAFFRAHQSVEDLKDLFISLNLQSEGLFRQGLVNTFGEQVASYFNNADGSLNNRKAFDFKTNVIDRLSEIFKDLDAKNARPDAYKVQRSSFKYYNQSKSGTAINTPIVQNTLEIINQKSLDIKV